MRGGPARRAILRWAWRLFRREWRQQLLVLALLSLAVATTTAGLSVATATVKAPVTKFVLPGSDPHLDADVAALRKAFAGADIVTHQRVAVPGLVASLDVRSQETAGRHRSLRLLTGRYPHGAGEVAVTNDVAATFDLRVGAVWQDTGGGRRVVGLVENPEDLLDEFALVAPGQADPPTTVTILVDAPFGQIRGFRLPSHTPLDIQAESATAKTATAVIVLALATVGLLFVGLVAVAGFAVMAQRRLRALGMLRAIGATDRHIRLVMLANGAVVGATASVFGTAVGLGGWLALAPRLETIVEHRIDRFDLAWWAVAAAVILAVAAAVGAAWWPARAAGRVPIVAALSGRPPRPQPVHRSAALGAGLTALGLVLLAVADQRRAPLIVAGTVATTVGVLLLAPVTVRAVGVIARRAPVAVRLAWRDLARYQGRSGAAVGAIVLAVGIAIAITVSATAQAATEGGGPGNLPANEILVSLNAGFGGFVPDVSAAEVDAIESRVDSMATSLHARAVIRLDAAVNLDVSAHAGPGGDQPGRDTASLVTATPVAGGGTNIDFVVPLYIATPDVLDHYGIKAEQIEPGTEVISSRSDLEGLSLFTGGLERQMKHPKIQTVHLPIYESDPNSLITPQAAAALGLTAVPSGWIIEMAHPLTPAEISTARKLAPTAIETKFAHRSLRPLGRGATVAGMLLALTVLAMTVGLIRSETARDLRTLTATGASARTRRTVTGATAAALAFLGAVLGTGGAYLALAAWYRSDLHTLGHVPYFDLVLVLAGLPVVAAAGGWLLAGREPKAFARQPLD